MMMFRKTSLVLAFLLGSAAAVPRGEHNGGSIRGAEERKLQMNMGGGGGGGGGGGDGGGGDGILEVHSCEPNPQRAIEFVDIMGYKEEGDMDCYADPVNACGGGCCRFGTYFICDTSNFAPHLACVCNANTAPLPVVTPRPTPAPVTAAPVTMPPVTAAPFTMPPVPADTFNPVTMPPATTMPVNMTTANSTLTNTTTTRSGGTDLFD